MAIRNWQVFLARELAARAGNTPKAHAVGALLVRGLVARNPQIDVAMLSFPQAAEMTQEAWSGADKPRAYVEAMLEFWRDLDVPTSGGVSDKKVRNALWLRAAVEYVDLPAQEHTAVAELVERSKALPWFGATTDGVSTGYGWGDRATADPMDLWDSSLSGLRGRGFAGLAGFGSLRDEIATVSSGGGDTEAVLRVYDALATSTSDLRRNVRLWQEWAAGWNYYTGLIDGFWGPKSESAFLIMRPEAYGRNTTFSDLITLNSMGGGSLLFGAQIAAGIARDKWLATNPSTYPDPVAVKADEATRFEVVVPERQEPITATTVTITPVATEEDPAPEPVRVEITLPQAEEEVVVTPIEEGVDNRSSSWTPWVVGGLGLLGLGAVVVATRKGK